MRRRVTTLIVLIVLLGIAGFVVLQIVGPAIGRVNSNVIATSEADAVNTSNSFWTAISAGDYDTAFAMIAADQQKTFGGSANGLKTNFQTNNWDHPSQWKFAVDAQGILSGTISFNGNAPQTIQMGVVEVDNIGKVQGIVVK